jgi:hypothetical protein
LPHRNLAGDPAAFNAAVYPRNRLPSKPWSSALMPSMEQLSNQAPSATYKNATDKKPAIVTRGMPVPHAGLLNSGRRLPGKMIGKRTRNRKLPKQGVPICQSPLAKSAFRPPRIA